MQHSLTAGSASPFRRLWQSYEQQLQRRPLAIQVATTAVLWGAGDVLAQRMAERRTRLDYRRVALTAAFGGSVLGPLGHWWYQSLDVFCSRFGAPGSASFLLSKLLVDNVVFNSMNITAFFAFGSGVIDREGPTAFFQKMREEFLPTFCMEASVWPPYMALIFTRVPIQHQLLAVNFGTLFDVCFLSWVRNHEGGLDDLVAALRGVRSTPAAMMGQVAGLVVGGLAPVAAGLGEAGPGIAAANRKGGRGGGMVGAADRPVARRRWGKRRVEANDSS